MSVVMKEGRPTDTVAGNTLILGRRKFAHPVVLTC
jgi:hypothetical protein